MANADQRPNCCCDRCSVHPSNGKIKRAIEFKMKIVPSEIAISSSPAPTIGATAAIALPPQIAVPVEIRIDAV